MEKPKQESKILRVCNSVVKTIDENGHEHENTKEVIDLRAEIGLLNVGRGYIIDLKKEEDLIAEYYGDRWEKRVEDEKYHYDSLRYGLLHKVKELKYFLGAPLENRKTIIFSNDCISSLQYIKRLNISRMIAYMRSSDAKELLPIDLLNLCKILVDIDTEYSIPGEITDTSLITHIGSAHYYISGGRT